MKDVKRNPENPNLVVASLNDEALKSVVNWLVKKENYSLKDANNAKDEFLQFASLALLTDDLVSEYPIVPPRLGDEFWHTFLMFNSIYNTWCQKHFGKVLNHFPGQALEESWSKSQNAARTYYGSVWSTPGSSSASFSKELCHPSIWDF